MTDTKIIAVAEPADLHVYAAQAAETIIQHHSKEASDDA